MSDAAALLRMLEPTVRPVPTSGGDAARPAALPIEQRSFDSLLAEAQQGGEAASDVSSRPAASPTAPLHGLDHVDNASLRELIAQRQITAAAGHQRPATHADLTQE